MAEQKKNTKHTTWQLVLVAAGMFAFGFALVPIYNVMCDITGLNGKVKQSVLPVATHSTDREVTIEFLSASPQGAAHWQVEPVTRRMRVKVGELYTANYIASNQRNQAIVGHAIPSVTPAQASRYLKKTDCFCFTPQPFAANETRTLPVRFYIDPAMPEHLTTVTVGYSVFDDPQSTVQQGEVI